jgi:formate C-acetyltransferase
LPGDCNVKEYILTHVTPYDGDAAFLAPPTARTLKTWKRCEELIELERQRGILDVDTRKASTITSHGPGYVLSREEDIIVGLQTDEPLKRACKPRGGFHVVGSALKSYGYQPDPDMAKTYTKVCNLMTFTTDMTGGDDVDDVSHKDISLPKTKSRRLRR